MLLIFSLLKKICLAGLSSVNFNIIILKYVDSNTILKHLSLYMQGLILL